MHGSQQVSSIQTYSLRLPPTQEEARQGPFPTHKINLYNEILLSQPQPSTPETPTSTSDSAIVGREIGKWMDNNITKVAQNDIPKCVNRCYK